MFLHFHRLKFMLAGNLVKMRPALCSRRLFNLGLITFCRPSAFSNSQIFSNNRNFLTFENFDKIKLRTSRKCRKFSTSSTADSDIKKSDNKNLGEKSINMTDFCAEKLKKVAGGDHCLRVLVDSGGCSGFEYKFELIKADEIDKNDDLVFEKNGAKLVVDAISLDFLQGATIDYQIELIKSAFRVVNNPKAAKGCSCGASFSLKTPK